MVLDELAINSRLNLERTLRDLSSPEEQASYKRAVPFVHVPIELLEQWSNHRRMCREQKWYRSLYSLAAHRAFDRLDRVIEAHSDRFKSLDVPEIFDDRAWASVGTLAREALSLVRDS